MPLSKTNFLHYLQCPKSLWLYKRDPEHYTAGEFSAFLQKLVRDGYEVERQTQRHLQGEGRDVRFQVVFEAPGLISRADIIETTVDGRIILYEVKSSTSIKDEAPQHHIKDVCFQKLCAERAGQHIDTVYLVHLNGSYVRDGDVDPAGLLTFVDVTTAAENLMPEVTAEIDAALAFLQSDIDPAGCSCLQKSRGQHCDSFSYFNPAVKPPSIFSLPRLSAAKRQDLIRQGIYSLADVPANYDLTANQRVVLRAAQSGTPHIDQNKISTFLGALSFPLHFFDFETYASAVPMLDRTSPHKAFPVQYSLHVLDDARRLSHREYLETELRLPDRLIGQMQADFGDAGTILAWHASFEKMQLREMARLFPAQADFLVGLESRVADLEDVFKDGYVDARCDGSTSIKAVLPVICPELSYEDLDIRDGGAAMEAWERLINMTGIESTQVATTLKAYCERDTLAMVRIYEFLIDISRGAPVAA